MDIHQIRHEMGALRSAIRDNQKDTQKLIEQKTFVHTQLKAFTSWGSPCDSAAAFAAQEARTLTSKIADAVEFTYKSRNKLREFEVLARAHLRGLNLKWGKG